MFIVLSRPEDDDEIVDTYIADHDEKSKDQFEMEWLVTKDHILDQNPEYNVSQIIVAMKRKGWRIISVAPAKVSY